jgi:hypothetical protein
VTFLLQERTEDVFALGRSLAARRTQAGNVGKGTFHDEFGDPLMA